MNVYYFNPFTLNIRCFGMALGNFIIIQRCNEFNKFKIKKKWGVMYGTSLCVIQYNKLSTDVQKITFKNNNRVSTSALK